eukprot:4933040-Pyramimonas_sp.AAC.1
MPTLVGMRFAICGMGCGRLGLPTKRHFKNGSLQTTPALRYRFERELQERFIDSVSQITVATRIIEIAYFDIA